MLAEETMAMMDFKVTDLFTVGKTDMEFMSSSADELASLETSAGCVSIQVTGEARFDFQGKTYRTRKDLEGETETITAIRQSGHFADENPWFEILADDWNGDFPTSEVIGIIKLLTKLDAKRMLMNELKNWFESSDVRDWLTDAQMDLREELENVHVVTVQLNSDTPLDSMEEALSDFLIGQEGLLPVVGCVEMEAVEDGYGDKWFSMQFYSQNHDAVRRIRHEIMKYGEIV